MHRTVNVGRDDQSGARVRPGVFRGDDMSEPPSATLLPTAKGFAMKHAIEDLAKRGIDASPLLRRAGLPEHGLHSSTLRVPAASQAKFLEYAAEAAGDSAFGLHLAEEMDPRSGGLLFYVASAAPNVEKALALFARYCRIGNESSRLKLEKIPEGLDVEFACVGVPRHRSRQITEFQLASVVRVCRFVTGLNLRPIRVAFAHARNSDLKPFGQFFGCGVEFAASSDRIAFSREALCASLVTEDRYLLETLQPFCEEAAKTRHTKAGTLRHAVENEIQRLLPHGNARAETVAKSLGLSLRTLSRRLAEEQTSFAEIVDQLRRTLAHEYLKEPDFALAQIAWLLGYERTSSFHHAHKRWTGHSPTRARPAGAMNAIGRGERPTAA